MRSHCYEHCVFPLSGGVLHPPGLRYHDSDRFQHDVSITDTGNTPMAIPYPTPDVHSSGYA